MKFTRGLFMICVLLILATISSYAAINVVPPAVYDPGIIPAINNVSPGDAIGTIISWMIGLTAVLTVLAVTWAGVQMILATGEEEKFKKARYIMIYAFIGLFVSGLAYAVVIFTTNLQLNSFL